MATAPFIINQLRTTPFDRAVISDLYVPGFGRHIYTLEDTPRPSGIKLPKITAIPSIVYQYAITHSPKFGSDMILLFNDPKTYQIVWGGNSWSGVRVHDGVEIDHTDACVLTGYDKVKDQPKIFNAANKDLVAYLKKTGNTTGLWIITEHYKQNHVMQ